MAVDEKWYFTKEQLLQSPSRKSGYDVDKELSCRQQAANFIQDMGQRLQVSQLCINTAIVYMHRFYVFHSLAAFHRNAIAAAALFLAAKVEEQPRKLEHVIKVAHLCLHRENPNLDTKSELYLEQAQDLVFNENVLLQTLGFDVAIDHPHTHVVRCCQLVRASKDLAQTSYFMASNSLHLTTMCLQYKPTVVACFCIHLACKWSNWEIPRSNEGKDWFWYIDKTVTVDLLEQLTAEFLAILDKCPTKLKRKMMSMNQNNTPGFTQQSIPNDSLHFEEPRKLTGSEANKPPEGLFPIQKSSSQSSSETKPGTSASVSSSASTAQPGHAHHQKIDYREYREKKERERIEREKQQQQQQHQRDGHNMSSNNHHHHSKSAVMAGKNHSNVQSRSSSGSVSHKSYQQLPHGVQQNVHFQNLKDSRDSSSQSFQSSSSKDSSYLKQHPSHGERDGSKDNTSFHGQYSQNSSNMQQKPNYSGSYPHREGSRGSHGVQGIGNSNLPQTHHNQNQNLVSNSSNLMNNSRDALIGSQRESAIVKDSDSQPQSKDSMSSSIRDIISQSVSQKDVHSMTNERKDHIRDKSRVNYIHGNSSTSNFRPESVKSGREQMGINFHESTDRKLDDFSKIKDKSIKKEEESVIETIKLENIKSEKFDETDVGDESGSWSFGMNLSNVRNEKNNLPAHVKTEPSAGKNEFSVDSSSDSFTLNKTQSMHSVKMMDPKYKSHHYHSNSKNSDISQIKIEKPGAQSGGDFNKKPNDRLHDKHRKPQELERVPNALEGIGGLNDVSKHHKLSKEGSSDKHKMMLMGQHSDQRMKEKLSPSKYQKMKALQRPGSLGYVKSEPPHFNLDAKSGNNSGEGDRIEGTNQPLSLKAIGPDDTNKSVGNLNSFQKQKSHEFGAPGNLSSSLPDQNFVKSSKTSSIFSPDSKIPPQNILNSLEKDSKKNISSTHRSQPSNKTPPDSAKKSVPTSVLGTITTSTTSTTGSLFSPPLPKNIPSVPPPRHRTSSSGSEPELIPVLTKLEETPGYENIMRERKVALTPSDSSPSNAEKDKKSSGLSEKTETSNAFLFDFDHKINTKDSKSNDVLPNEVKSEVLTQSVVSKPVVNVKFPNEIRSDLGAVIYPTNPKSTPISKPSQGYSLGESKLSLANSVSTVNLLGIEKMVDTSISPAKQSTQFGSSTVKSSIPNPTYNSTAPSVNTFAPSSVDQNDKIISEQKNNVTVSSQDSVDVDVLGYSEKKRSEKKKKKEKHKHKEKDKSERKKEKKKHKDKDKERSKEKEKHKDKDKHKEKHREKEIDVVSSETPIKITIPKDKISGSLKIKISKDCLKKDDVEPPKPNTSGELKIKISKDVFSNIGTYKEESKNESRKRERSPKSSADLPHSKAMKTSDKKSSASSLKPNGMEGSSRNSNSHRYSVSENDSCFDISSLYDCPFDFEENGQGIIKTPDYDFEALNASEFPQESNTSPDSKEIEDCDKNSHNESELSKDNDRVATGETEVKPTSPKELDSCFIDDSCGDIAIDLIPKPISPLKTIISPEHFIGEEPALKARTSTKLTSLNENQFDIKRDENLDEVKHDDSKANKMISLKNCDVLKNYKTILDSHSRRCESEILKHSVSPISPEENTTETNSNNDDNNNKNSTDEVVTNHDKSTSKGSKNSSDTENPNYYNKYFKKDNGSRIPRSREDKWSVKDKGRFDDRQRYYDNRRYRTDYNERDRRDDRRYYRDYREYSQDASQYYYERKEERRFDYSDYSAGPYFSATKAENNLASLNYDINANGTPTVYQGCNQAKTTTQQFPQICETAIPGSSSEMNISYQYGFFNNYMYPPNGGYRFYGNVPFVNVSLMQQQPIPPGTGDSSIVQLEPPPLPLEPPPDLPPPPETPPPPK